MKKIIYHDKKIKINSTSTITVIKKSIKRFLNIQKYKNYTKQHTHNLNETSHIKFYHGHTMRLHSLNHTLDYL